MAETLAHGYSSESTQQELSNEYQHDTGVDVFSKNLCIFVLWTRVAATLSIRKIRVQHRFQNIT